MSEQTTAVSLLANSAEWLWNNYGEGFSEWLQAKAEDKAKEKGVEVAQNRWKTFQWQRAEKDYREKVAKLYGTTRILGNSEPTPLEGIFTDLYILDKPLALRRYSLDDLQASNEKLRGHEIQRREGIAVVKQENSHRLFILGKPGAGKTTFLKYITLQAVKGELPQTPVFVGLREWSESNKTLMEFIVEQFAICNFPKADSFIEYLLEKGKAILLLDGLDEVNSEHNKKVIKEVKLFCKKYDKTQCLITCRVAGVDYSFEDFKYMEVADFTDAQIETFVTKWFTKEPIKCEKFLTEFKQEQYRGLRELASSPLLLGMLCLAFANSMEFTTRRVDIYEDAIDALLRKWDSSRSISRDVIYHDLTHQLKKRLFTFIAYKTFSDNEYLIKEQELAGYLSHCLKTLPNPEKQELDGEVVLKAIEAQHGIFVERAQKIHSFSHLTFQEYFTACAIKGNVNYQKQLMQHITDSRWREVFLLTVSLLDDADDFFNLFKKTIDELIKIDTHLVDILQWVNTKSQKIDTPYSSILYSRAIYMLFDYSISLAFNNYNQVNFHFGRDSLLDMLKILRDFDIKGGYHSSWSHTILELSIKLTINNDKYYQDINCDYLLIEELLMILPFVKTANFGSLLRWTKEDPSNEINYEYVINFFHESIDKINCFGFIELAQKLTDLMLIFPNKNASITEWNDFYEVLRNILQTQRNIAHEWQLTRKQFEDLEGYIYANSLLLDCLKLATVSDREAIKNSLFLPPNQAL